MKRDPMDEAYRWLDQAENDLHSAEWNREGGVADIACFLYLPSRYPNALPGGIPHLGYTKEKAEEVIACAKRVIEKVKVVLAGGSR